MPVLLLILLAGVLVYLVISRQGSTLTRACRWRLDRNVGPGHHACTACGATCDLPVGRQPRQCLARRA